MVWACFVGTKLGPIAFIDGTVNTTLYIKLLSNNLLPFIDVLRNDGVTDIVFQQDNASCHVSKTTKAYLETAMNEHEFTVMQWPANSPDMNLIENLWAHLKTELHKQYPDTLTLQGLPHTIRTALCDRLNKVWWEIGEEVLDRLVDSMPRRVQALIDAKGWYMEY